MTVLTENELKTVVKRCGNTEKFNRSKIDKCIDWASEGLFVDPKKVKDAVYLILENGISTELIHDVSIEQALHLANVNEPEYTKMAGRLFMMKMKKDINRKRSQDISFYQQTVLHCEKGLYDTGIINYYSNAEFNELEKKMDDSRDYIYDYAGAAMLKERYLLPGELPQEMFMIIAMLLAAHNGNTPKDLKMVKAKQIYDAISSLKISLATPFLCNLRQPGGSLSSCFVSSMDDDLDSIFNNIHENARISKNGGGCAVNVSKIRAVGSTVNKVPGVSGGVLPWIRLLNDTGVAVNQG